MRQATIVFNPRSETPLCLRLSEKELKDLVEELRMALEDLTEFNTSGELSLLATIEYPLVAYQDETPVDAAQDLPRPDRVVQARG